MGRESTRPVSRSGRAGWPGGAVRMRGIARGRGGVGGAGTPLSRGCQEPALHLQTGRKHKPFWSPPPPPAPDTASEPTLLHLRGGSGWSSPRPTGGSETLNELQCGRYFGQVSMALRPRTGCFISRLYISMPSVAFTRVPVRSGAGIQGAPAVNTPLPAEGPTSGASSGFRAGAQHSGHSRARAESALTRPVAEPSSAAPFPIYVPLKA